jgi:hypothetical protein
MNKTVSVYGLCFDTEEYGPVIFYVGRTGDAKVRASSHRSSAKDLTDNTYKYQFCRELDAVGIEWRLEVLVESVEDTEDSEYEWVLKFARHNQSQGIEFYNGMPLTNMKAGDFLDEMLRDKTVVTAEDIKMYKQKREAKHKTEIDYTRGNTFGDQSRGRNRRREVADSLVVITEQKRTEDVIKELDRAARESRRIEQLKIIRAEQEAHWLATGQLIGENKNEKH